MINKITRLTGIDPVTGERMEGGIPPVITGADAITLMAQVNTVQETPYKNPDLELNLSRAWKFLTGGSRETIVKLEGDSPSTINALKMEADMITASRQPNFNPNDWYDKNIDFYKTTRVIDNEKALTESQLEVYKGGGISGTDWNVTKKNIKEARKKGMPDSIFIPLMAEFNTQSKNAAEVQERKERAKSEEAK